MCLTIDKNFESKFRQRNKGKKTITVYKVLVLRVNRNNKAFFAAPITLYKYKAGWNKSNRKRVVLNVAEINNRSIDYGIHVFTNKSSALSFCNAEEYVFACKANMKDLIAAGSAFKNRSAAFMKIFLPVSEMDKAIAEYNLDK